MIVVGFTGLTGFKTEQKVVLAENEQTQVKNYTIELTGLYSEENREKVSFGARLNVYKNNTRFATMTPEKRIHRGREKQPHAEVDVRSILQEDLYIIYAGTDGNGRAVPDVHINPLTAWIWIGGLIMTFGTLIALAPKRKATKDKSIHAPSAHPRVDNRAAEFPG